jgi:hypothetical protein
MIYYNVTIKVDPSVNDEWISWMKQKHIPDVIGTGLFFQHKMCKLLDQDETDGITYTIQYGMKNMVDYLNYQENFSPKLQKEHGEKYKGKFVAFRTIMEEV